MSRTRKNFAYDGPVTDPCATSISNGREGRIWNGVHGVCVMIK